jgi:hypothetical protein
MFIANRLEIRPASWERNRDMSDSAFRSHGAIVYQLAVFYKHFIPRDFMRFVKLAQKTQE